MMSGDETATGDPMQDIASRVEGALFPSNEEPQDAEFEEVLDDEEALPDNDDSDDEEEKGSEDLQEIAKEEDLSLGEYLGVDDDQLIVDDETGSIMFNAIIDGETTQVPLKDVITSYQLQGHVNNKSIALENERKEFEEIRNKASSELSQRLDGAIKLSNIAEQELVQEYNSINWDQLRTSDPANWTALRQEYAEKAQKIQEVQKLTLEQAEAIQIEQQQLFAARAQQYNEEQLQLLIQDNPHWADEKVRYNDMKNMRSFIERYGFTEEDANNVNDHRLIRLIKDAQTFIEGSKSAENKKDKKELPKFQKPGSRTKNSASLAKARAAKAAKARLKQSGSIDDAAALLVDKM